MISHLVAAYGTERFNWHTAPVKHKCSKGNSRVMKRLPGPPGLPLGFREGVVAAGSSSCPDAASMLGLRDEHLS